MKSAAKLLFGLLSVALAGDVGAAAREEFWPELDVWVPVSEPTRLLLTSSARRDRETGDRADADLGAYVDYRATERVSWRLGYVYSTGRPRTPEENRTVENRLVGDFTYRWRFGDMLQLADRTRLDVRDIERDFSYRFRNRLRLEHAARIRSQPFSSYVSFEAYYDDRFDAVSRYRLEFGVSTPITSALEVETYLGRQRDTRPSRRDTDGIGITLSLMLR